MNILISSHAFYPSIGGIETVSNVLAGEFVSRGHEIVVVTQTLNSERDDFPFRVTRRPKMRELLSLVKWCDVVWQNNLSLRTLWPICLSRRPVVVTHAGSYCVPQSRWDWRTRVKQRFASMTTGVAISSYVANCIDSKAERIPNPFNSNIFYHRGDVQQSNDLIFVGRLIQEKGVDLLLDAMHILTQHGFKPALTIVGDGPYRDNLETRTRTLELKNVVFLGAKNPRETAGLLQTHKILVVPSCYEAFGIVAVEGIACGCRVLASEVGGLPDAVGPCGRTFPNGDPVKLAHILMEMLSEAKPSGWREMAEHHVSQFKADVVADRYLALFSSLCR